MVFKTIIKRDGRVVDFDISKITDAVAKAGRATGEFDKRTAEKFGISVLNIAYQIFGSKTPTVEEIQDIVEEVLIRSPFIKTAKAYIIYREQHTRLRELKNAADISLVDSYLEKMDWEVKENSNMSFSIQGLNN